jgi:hypothetical protein
MFEVLIYISVIGVLVSMILWMIAIVSRAKELVYKAMFLGFSIMALVMIVAERVASGQL